jgi:membrane protein DedA with SNARE-associated domain
VADVLTYVATPAWAYVALWVLLSVDAFVPVFPTQAIMITSGALTVYGGLDLSTTIAVGAIGVLTGDVSCYLIGRGRHRRLAGRTDLGPVGRLTRWLARPGAGLPRRVARRTARRAGRLTVGLRQPGPMVILLCRFVPGGRMAGCYSAGRVAYPASRFLPYEVLGAVGWASYGAMVGHLAGTAVTKSAWRLVAVAAIAATVFAAAGWVLALGNRREAARQAAGPAPKPASEPVPASEPLPAHSSSCNMSWRAASVKDPDRDG